MYKKSKNWLTSPRPRYTRILSTDNRKLLIRHTPQSPRWKIWKTDELIEYRVLTPNHITKYIKL